MNSATAVWYYNTAENSDKIHITIYDGSVVTTYWGRRGASLSSKGKVGSYSDYSKTVSSKTCKGYEPIKDVSMLKDLARQLDPAHTRIFNDAYGISGGSVSGLVSAPAPKAKVVEPDDEPATPIHSLGKGEKMVVECVKAVDGEFEVGIEYYCTEWNGLVMKVQNMLGKDSFVLPSYFKMKGKA